MADDFPSKSEVYGTFNTLSDRLDDLDTHVAAGPITTLTAGKGFVAHGAVAGTARPVGFASIEWLGSVEPTNGVDNDTWVVTI